MQAPSTPQQHDISVVKTEPEASGSLSQIAARSRTPLGMRSVNAAAGPSRLSRTPSPLQTQSSSVRPVKARRGLYRQFVPPARTRPPTSVKTGLIGSQPGPDLPDPESHITDVKPSHHHRDVKPNIPMKRERSASPIDVKPFLPGSRSAPILVDDDNTGQALAIQAAEPAPPLPAVAPVIVQNVVYNIVHVHNHIVYQDAPRMDNGRPLDLDPPLARVNTVQVPVPLAAVPPVPNQPALAAMLMQPNDPDFVPYPGVAAPLREVGPPLSPIQQRILDTVITGHNVLIHGSAGTGKSVLIRAIKQAFAQRYEALHAEAQPPPDRNAPAGFAPYNREHFGRTYEDRLLFPLPEKKWKLRVTASTGLAAVNVGGTTFHGFVGAALCKGEMADMVEMIQRTAAADEWTSTAALVIDEISMVDGKLFDRVDRIGRAVRGNNRPFGGLQIIACGDFLQLPPIGEEIDNSNIKIATFAFDSEVWPQLFHRNHQYNLERNFRQEDAPFRQLLERMRRGYLDRRDHTTLRSLRRNLPQDGAIQPVFLMPLRKAAEDMNLMQLLSCPGRTTCYMAQDTAGQYANGERLTLEVARKKLNEETRFPEKLELRIGAQVMLILNCKETFLVNGTTGEIIDFMTRDEAAVAKIPSPSITDFFSPPRDVKYPVVRFAKMRYCDEVPPPAILIPAMTSKITVSRDIVVGSRTQIPLILAWALTIHKAQGQTLDRVKVDVTKCGHAGQAYTAISRCTSKEGLQILGYKADCVQVDAVAERWLRELEGDEDYMAYAEQDDD